MKLLLDIKDDKAAFIIELLRNFKFVKSEPLTSHKAEVLRGIKTSIDEVKQINEGKIEGIPAEQLLDEL